MKRFAGGLAAVALVLGLAATNSSIAQTIIENKAGKKLGINDIRTRDGDIIATEFITGSYAKTSRKGYIIEGEGIVEAKPGKYFGLMFVVKCHIDGKDNYMKVGVNTNKISWDKDGNTKEIGDIEDDKILTSYGNFNIDGPVLLKNGVLLAKSRLLGEFRLKFSFWHLGNLLAPDCQNIMKN